MRIGGLISWVGGRWEYFKGGIVGYWKEIKGDLVDVCVERVGE